MTSRHADTADDRAFRWGELIDDPAHAHGRSWSTERAGSSRSVGLPSLPGAAAAALEDPDASQRYTTRWPALADAEAFPGRIFDTVTGWWDYQRLMRGTPQQRKALEAGHPARTYQSWIDVSRRVSTGGTAALDLVMNLIDAAPSDDDIALVGTGPLEDLVRKHGNTLADRIAHLASQDARFARALTTVVALAVLSPYAAHRLSPWVS